MALAETLLDLGFTRDEASKSAAEANAEANGMSSNGAYVVQDVFVRGEVVVTVEQNQAPEDFGGGMSAIVTHPPLAIIASPKGRVAFNPEDLELAANLANELS